MVDVREQATLRGFHVSIADIDDQMHLAHRLDWRDDPDAMAATDPDEASQGTLLPMTSSPPIASGQGVVAAGAAFVQAAECAGVQLDYGVTGTVVDGALTRTGDRIPFLKGHRCRSKRDFGLRSRRLPPAGLWGGANLLRNVANSVFPIRRNRLL